MKHNKSKSILLMLLLLFFILLGFYVHSIYQESISQKQYSKGIRNNQDKWNFADQTYYRIEVTNSGYTHDAVLCRNATVVVKDNRVIDLYGDIFSKEYCKSTFEELTISNTFLVAKNMIERKDPVRVHIREIDFDSNYGYITNLCASVTPLFFDNQRSQASAKSFCITYTNFASLSK